MGCPLLYGSHELTIDEKNRLLVPANIRRCFDPEKHGSAFFIKLGTTNEALWLYPERYYEELASREPSGLTPTIEDEDFNHSMYGLVDRLEWDKQGRVVLPDEMLRLAGVNKDVVLVGVRDHLELWDGVAWKQHKDGLLKRRSEVAKLHQVRGQQGGA